MPDEHGEQSQHKENNTTIYDAGYGSIFFRNFLSGFSRALGAIFVYLILGGLIYYLTVTYIVPQLQKILPNQIPLFNLSQPGSGTGLSPQDIEGAIRQYQQNQGQPPASP